MLNVFDRACNLTNQAGEVLALVTSERGLTPFALVVGGDDRTPFRGLPTDSLVRVERATRRLSLGPLCIDYGAAKAWQARPDWRAVRLLFALDPGRLANLAELAAEVDLSGSLLDLYRPDAPAGDMARALLSLARRGAIGLVQGLAAHDPAMAGDGARALAGLGGGLTPAGDDFVVGAILAAWAGVYGPGAEQMGAALAEAAAERTTTLSAAYLRAAGRGECLAHWHSLFEALAGSEGQALRTALHDLVNIGHTSGADALAGFIAFHYVPATGA